MRMSSAASTVEGRLIDDLQKFARKLNRTPTAKELNDYGPRSAPTYQGVFGSWNAALEAADLDPNVVHNVSSETLREDIERVAGVLQKAPSLKEMDRFGKFSSKTYSRKMDSYVGMLEELGLDPEPVQYASSNRDPPREKQATKNVRKLRKDGPTPRSKLPSHNFNLSDKRHGMTSFSIKTGHCGSIEPVYYLFDDHDPDEVLRTFFEFHTEIFRHKTEASITQQVGRYGRSWKKAVRRVLNTTERTEYRE
jgi:hypothetical protein